MKRLERVRETYRKELHKLRELSEEEYDYHNPKSSISLKQEVSNLEIDLTRLDSTIYFQSRLRRMSKRKSMIKPINCPNCGWGEIVVVDSWIMGEESGNFES